MNPPSIPERAQDNMVDITSSDGGFLKDFLIPILTKIGGDTTREALIKINWMISGNTAPLASNIGRGQNGHLTLTMTLGDYMEQTGYAFVPPQNLGNYPPKMGTSQE